jgi:serine/threonine protein kinase
MCCTGAFAAQMLVLLVEPAVLCYHAQVLQPAPTGIKAAEAVPLVRQLLLALQHLHKHSIVHRDVKVRYAQFMSDQIGQSAGGRKLLVGESLQIAASQNRGRVA